MEYYNALYEFNRKQGGMRDGVPGMRYESDGKCRYAGLAVIVRIVAQTLCFSKNEAESPNIAGLSFKT